MTECHTFVTAYFFLTKNLLFNFQNQCFLRRENNVGLAVQELNDEKLDGLIVIFE